MAYTFPTTIGTRDLQIITTYTYSGYLHLFVEKSLFRRSKWDQKYIFICKANTHKCTWNMCCYENAFADKAEINYSMLEFESVQEYDVVDAHIIGFTMKFEEPTRRPLVFRCDTKESRNKWIEHIRTAIQDAHKDSGYSSDTDRQSKKYDTIDDVEISAIDKLHITETDKLNNTGELKRTGDLDKTGGLDNTSRTIGSWQMKSVATYKESELDDTDDGDNVAKHCYENMLAENNTFTRFKRNASCQGKHGTNTDGKQRNLEETYVKEVISHSVQETDNTGIDKPSTNAYQKHKPENKCTANKYTQHPAAKSPETVNKTDHVYENMAYGFMKALKSDNSVERGPTSSSESESLPDPSVNIQASSYPQSKDDNTVLKLPVSSTTVSSIRENGITSSLKTVRGCSGDSLAVESEAFVSVRGTIDSKTVQSPIRNVNIHSKANRSNSFASPRKGHVCSPLSKAKSFSQERGTTSASKRLTNNTRLQEKLTHSISEDSASFASVREDVACSSLSSFTIPKSTGLQSENMWCVKEKQKRSTSTDSSSLALVRNSPVSSLPETSVSSETKVKDDANLSLCTSASCAVLTRDDGEVIYENTDTYYIAANNNYCRQDSEISRSSNSSNLHSTSSSSSFSSRDSNASLKSYESPDEGAHYENIKFFQKEEYYCSQKSDAKRMLENKLVGTFLVCPGKSGLEMCVMTPDGIKYFRIHEQEEKISLFRSFSNPDFVLPNLDTLLRYYHINFLPSSKYKVTLERGYKAKEKDSG